MTKRARMEIGVSTAAFYGKLLTEEATEKIAESGAECCEVFLQTDSEYTLEFARTVKKSLSGVPCSSVHPLGTAFENQLFSRSERQREDARDRYLRILDTAAELGARNYVYHGRNTPQLSPLPFDAQRNADVVGKMCEMAAERGLTLAWENVYWCQLTTPERAREMRMLLPEVRFTLDNKQAIRAGADPFDFLSSMGDAIVNVHLCDYDTEGKLALPGDGSFPFRRFLAALSEVSPGCSVILEPYSYLIRGEQDVPQALAFLKAAVAGL
ncbi:MAG: sugar phosphate isomerase/epimerase [Clostridiales bacterium]|nr:sugar phosphate isomerase/epimerase [Clostridiales bacterium]